MNARDETARLRPLLPIAVAVVLQLMLLAVVLSGTIWPPKAALLVGEQYAGQLALVRDPAMPIATVEGGEAQFTWAVALDPLATDPEVAGALDDPALRYQRILFPLAAWLIHLGPGSLAYRLWALAAVGWGLGAYAFYQLARWSGAPGGPALLLYACNPGLLCAVLHPLPDGWAVTLVLWALLYWVHVRRGPALALFALAGLTSETALIVPISLAIASLVRVPARRRQSLALLATALPLLAWDGILRLRLHAWPLPGPDSIDLPGFALVRIALDVLLTGEAARAAALLAALGLGALAVYTLLRTGWPPPLMGAVLWGQAIVAIVAGRAVLEPAGSASRATALLLLILELWLLRELRSAWERAVTRPRRYNGRRHVAQVLGVTE